jgi:hypothetical protein
MAGSLEVGLVVLAAANGRPGQCRATVVDGGWDGRLPRRFTLVAARSPLLVYRRILSPLYSVGEEPLVV